MESLPDGKKLDATHVRTSPLVRTASTGMVSFVILGAGCASLLRSYKQYKTNSTGEIKLNANVEEEEEEESSSHIMPILDKEQGGLWDSAVCIRKSFVHQIQTQFQHTIEDDGYENRNNHMIRQYAITGGTTGLGMYLLGPSALSLPVPLLCYLCNDSNSINNHAGQISPQEAFDSLIA